MSCGVHALSAAAADGTVSAGSILVAGVGNIFLRDDGFGSVVTRQLANEQSTVPLGVRIVDYGIRGMHLAYDLLDGVDALILVDALPARGEEPENSPGAVRVLRIRPGDVESDAAAPALDPHGMDPLTVLARLRALGGDLPLTYVVGCVPSDTDEGIGLSDVVAAAIPEAIARIRTLAAEHIPAVRFKGEQ